MSKSVIASRTCADRLLGYITLDICNCIVFLHMTGPSRPSPIALGCEHIQSILGRYQFYYGQAEGTEKGTEGTELSELYLNLSSISGRDTGLNILFFAANLISSIVGGDSTLI
jgi:hypothetical protein